MSYICHVVIVMWLSVALVHWHSQILSCGLMG